MMSIMERYIEEIKQDLIVNDFNIKEVQLRLPARKHFWVARLIDAKIKRNSLLRDKKNKRHEIVETDWKSYTSSSLELNKDIELYGKDKFTFNIVKWCESKAELAYFEAKLQFECNVLFSDDYYNGIINCRLCRFKIKDKK